VGQLSNSQKDAIKATLTPALSGSHTALAQLCSNLMAEHHLSYAALRELMDGRLPDYLATPSALKPRKKPTPRSLTTEQKAKFIAAYRHIHTTRTNRSLSSLYRQFEELYRVPRTALKELIASDLHNNPDFYRELEQKQREQPKKPRAKQIKPPGYYGRATLCPVCGRDFDTNLVPPHGPNPNKCRGSGRLGVTRRSFDASRLPDADERPSDWSLISRKASGGLPGSRRRH
jgi:hypothetical protein